MPHRIFLRITLRTGLIVLLMAAMLGLSLGPGHALIRHLTGSGQPEAAVVAQGTTPTSPSGDESELPPALISSTPADNALWDGGPVVFTFDQPLDQAIGSGALTVDPHLTGRVEIEGTELTFVPDTTPEPGMRYTFRISPSLASAAGVGSANPVEVTLQTAVPLQVTSIQPQDGAAEVDTDSQVIITFNRPVVPLTGLDDQADLPNPLTFDPAVEGEGRWLNTSVYVFQAETAFAGSTEYTLTVGGITGLSGETLAAPVIARFTTASPMVVDASPAGGQVPPDATVRVEFSQPMDPDSTAAAFSLRKTGDDPAAKLDGEFDWHNTNRTLVFTPTAALEFGNRYLIEIAASAQPASRQGSLREAFRRSFAVVPLPAVQTVSPLPGAQEVTPDASVIIRFNAPVSPTLVLDNIQVTPLLTTTQVFSYYSEYLNELQLSWFKEPRTTYTVSVGADVADPYGNTLGEDYVMSFTTGDYAPFVRLETERFTHFSAFSETRASLLYRNAGAVNVDLYRLPESELWQLTGSNQWQTWENYQIPNAAANLIWSRSYDPAEETNITVRQVITLTDETGDRLAPGLYFLQAEQPEGTTPEGGLLNRSQSLIVLSNHNLTLKWSRDGTSLAWLTDLATGQAVANQPVRFFSEGVLAGEAVTGDDGTAMLKLDVDAERYWAPIVAMAGTPGDPDFALVASEWSSGIAAWDFGINGGWSLDALQSYFYSDRPIYRPGQTVYWKGIVRLLQDEEYFLPPQDLTAHIVLRDPMGNAIVDEERTFSANGTLDGKVELSSEAMTGSYFMEVQMALDPSRPIYSGLGFTVAAYRKPEFEISVTPSQPEYRQGETVQINAQANYYSGGPLANAPVTWRLISNPYYFAWSDAPEDRYYSFAPFDPDQAEYDPYSGSFNLGLIREGSGQTAADGSFTIELPADLGGAPQSQSWSFDITVQSPTNQFVSARADAIVHKAAYYVGLSPRAYVSTVGEEVTVDLVTLTPQGEMVPDAALEVVAYEFQWNSVYAQATESAYRWETSVNRTPVYTATVTTDAGGEAVFAWTPDTAGQYQIVAQGEDDDGNTTGSSLFVWVSAADPSEFVAWPRENNDRIELVADKSFYKPGDTARVLVPSPFTGPVEALVTIERGGVVSAEVITLEGNSETIEIPIHEEHIPNIFVGIVIAKGIDETNPTPAMRVGYTQLTVDTSAKELTLDVQSSAQTVEPGASVAYTLTVTGLAGEPVPGAEVSVAVVDRAVLALTPEMDRPLVDIFYYERPLGVSTSALLTINQDRMSQQLSEGAKGGGGGGGDGMDLRSEFPDIAFWRASLVSDDAGRITFTVDLPGNLTTWRLAAKAVTGDTRVGNGVYDVVATKDLQVRPLVPRFFTAGDQARIGAAILNARQSGLVDGRLSLEVEGAGVQAAEQSVPFDLDPAGQTSQTWPITVDPTAAQVVITLTATAETVGDEAETIGDAVRLVIPVMRYESPETVATAGVVPTEGTLEVIHLPDAATDNGSLDIAVEPSLAGGLIAGLDYLEHYPYECTEQVVSSFLPNLFTVRALQTLEVDNPELSAGLDEQVNLALQRLTTRQNQDGGWGYWPGERSSVFITAYVLWGLAGAGDLGYTVPERTINLAVDYLERSFLAPKDVLYNWQLNEMAFMHFVLAEIDRGDPGRASTLYDVRDRLGHYGKAYLAMALAQMSEAGAADARVQTLLSDLAGAAELSATGAWWQEEELDYRTLNTDIRTTSIVLDAFARLAPDQPVLPQVVRWLMVARQGGYWSTTQENAWAIIALTDWLAVTGELQADYAWTVTLNDEEVAAGSVTPGTAADKVDLRVAVAELLRDEANALRFTRDAGQGSLYYTTHLRYYLDAASVEARDRGIVVDRQFRMADGRADGAAVTAVDSAAVGDVISVTVTLVAPTDLHHLLVEVPIPAGTEPIDPSLLTTSDQFMDPMMTMEPVESEQPAWWRYWVPTYTNIRDDKVALFATFLSAGTYEYTFNVQATLPGDFLVLPAHAEQMYFTEVWGRSAGQRFSVTE